MKQYEAEIILRDVGKQFHVDPQQLLDPGRVAQVADARAVAMFLLRVKHGWTYAGIGKLFGRDYSSCVHACQKMQRRIDQVAWIDGQC